MRILLLAFAFVLSSFANKTLAEADTLHRNTINQLLDESWELSYDQKDSSISLCLEALDLAFQHRDTSLIADSYDLMGQIYNWFALYDSSNYYFEKALIYAEPYPDTAQLISMESLMGLNYINLGQYQSGMQHLIRAENLAELSGIEESLGWVYYYISLAYHDQENDFGRLNNLLLAKKIFENQKDSSGIFEVNADILMYYIHDENPDSIQKYFDLFYSQYRSIPQVDEDPYFAFAHYTYASYLDEIGQLDSAEYYYRLALESSESTHDRFSYSSYSYSYTYMLCEQGRLDEAEKQIRKSLQIARELDSPYLEREGLLALSNYFNASKAYDSAYTTLLRAVDLSDSISNDRIEVINLNNEVSLAKQKNMVLAAQQQQLELEKTLLENQSNIRLLILGTVFILLLGLIVLIAYVWRNNKKYKKLNHSLFESQRHINRKNKEIRRSQAQLQMQKDKIAQAYLTQGKILSIVGHDLRTPLAQIKNILELERSGALTPIEKAEIFRELERTTVASLEMLSSLVNWGKAKLQTTENQITHSEAIRKLTDESAELYSTSLNSKNLALSFVETDSVTLPISELQTAVIVRNLIYNAIKFSNFNSEIQVETIMRENGPSLIVRDFGIGMNETKVRRLMEGQNIESERGTQNEGGFGLGMWFVRDIAMQNNGTFRIESELGNGSQFEICFTAPTTP